VTCVYEAARAAHAVGLAILPVAADGSKRPDVATWKMFQVARPTISQMRDFDFANRAGIGVISGAVSQRRECWDFDDFDIYKAFVEAATACGLDVVVQRIIAGFENATPGGGRRWIVEYPESVEWKDCTLARRPGGDGEPRVKTLIELPMFAIVAPSTGGTHPSGKPYIQLSGGFDTIASYSADERDALLDLARSFDRMPRREAMPRARASGETKPEDRPGDDFNRRMTWPGLLEPAGWQVAFKREDVTYWRRPGKDVGVSATTNFGGSGLFFPFTSSTLFEPERSYSKFAAYTTLEHGGDFGKAALALSKLGYGDQQDIATGGVIVPATPHTLAETIAVFRKWLSLADPTSVCAVAAALVANRAPGDPVWLLLVSAPSTGKTELLSSATRLPWVLPAAKVTEASLLSGTSKRERTRGATGGLLRQVGEFGVVLCKDFTSVLAQNKDARAEAMAALREVYDGAWDRPVGTDGGRILSWRGKCGLIGGVTPALDQYGQVVSALGDRFVLLRMPDANVEDFGAAALRHGDREQQMRQELREALAGLVEQADLTRVNRLLTDDERTRLIRLAAYTARARTAVVRDGYGQEVAYCPQVEGPGRLVKAYARLLGGLEAIGCDAATAWGTLTRIAIDCAPALRTKAIRALVAHSTPIRTRDVAIAMDTVTKTAARYLEDLSLLKIAVHTKHSDADNSPDRWEASDWLREHWPESETEKYTHAHKTRLGEGSLRDISMPADVGQGRRNPQDTSQSHFAEGSGAPQASVPVADEELPVFLLELREPDLSDPIGAGDEPA
jgi:hypothetical protein